MENRGPKKGFLYTRRNQCMLKDQTITAVHCEMVESSRLHGKVMPFIPLTGIVHTLKYSHNKANRAY